MADANGMRAPRPFGPWRHVASLASTPNGRRSPRLRGIVTGRELQRQWTICELATAKPGRSLTRSFHSGSPRPTRLANSGLPDVQVGYTPTCSIGETGAIESDAMASDPPSTMTYAYWNSFRIICVFELAIARRLNAKLLLHLQSRDLGRSLVHVGIDERTDTGGQRGPTDSTRSSAGR